MHVNRRPALRGHAPRARGNRPAARSINRITVLLSPLPYFRQPLHKLRLNLSIRHRADIQQEIRIHSRRAHQVANQIRGAFVPIVGDIKSPRIVHRFASLQRQNTHTLLRVEACRVPARQILLEHLKILPRKRILVVIAANQRLRLQLVNHGVRALKMPIRVGLVPHPVEPHAAKFSIVRKQLAQLPIHEVQIGIPVPGIRPPRAMPCPPAGKIILRMPIELRVIHKQLDSLLVALRREHTDHVFSIGRACHDVPIRQLGIEHRKAIVMF